MKVPELFPTFGKELEIEWESKKKEKLDDFPNYCAKECSPPIWNESESNTEAEKAGFLYSWG